MTRAQLPRNVPALGRRRAAEGSPGLFAGRRLVLRGPVNQIAIAELESLVTLGGGEVVPATAPEASADPSVVVVISNSLVTEKDRRALDAASAGLVVDQSWLLDSISLLQCLPLGAYRGTGVGKPLPGGPRAGSASAAAGPGSSSSAKR